MTQKKAELLLAAVIVARATSFLFNKIGLATIGIFNILGIRYSLAFILLAVLFRDRLLHLKRDTVIRAALLSVSFFAIMTCELSSLKRTDPSTTAFLENTAVAFVPLFEAVLLRRLPSRITMAGTGLALCGVACLTLKNGFGGFGPGELFGIAAAMFYAGYIILTSRLSVPEALETIESNLSAQHPHCSFDRQGCKSTSCKGFKIADGQVVFIK